MTRPPNTSSSDDSKAKAFFTACLTIGGGFAGLAVAGIVLGFDYLLHGEPHERDRLAQQRADRRINRYADALAWLDDDRAARARHRQALRDWFVADPATRGDRPASGETAGRVTGRAWRNLLVGWRRFKNGWDQGRAGARQRRDNNEPGWWKQPTDNTGGGQPAQPDPAGPDVAEVNPVRGCPRCSRGVLRNGLCDRCGRPDDPRTDPAPGQTLPGQSDAQEDTGAARPLPPDWQPLTPQPEPPLRVAATVGDTPTPGPDPALDDYQQRIDNLGHEIAATSPTAAG
ncbi:hypothetical protein [Pseudosporangium ferrugineum]|uniref:Uncharacterized protein n=1 Tax=Pseudosporangium ferrugineum TaxID=439699 RepID=A0A2T0RS82_9ACTN|nr:hypothetical protein [Pseudosporangium ferrugineum]PRY24028.1 hypothetical protein CLV70_114161 [Pseudosporangium ferrugineum]